MAKLIVVSDSHGHLDVLKKIAQAHPDMDFMIHLGDGNREFLSLQDQIPECQLRMVRGNCDFGSFAPATGQLVCSGRKILFTHGQDYYVKQTLDRLKLAGKAAKAAAILYGHTHIAHTEMDGGMLVFNPGCVSDYRNPTYGILTVDEEKIQSEIVRLR